MHDYQAPPELLKDKVILVTGASDGIGRAAAIEYARLGATVILLARDQNKLARVYDHIEGLDYPQPAMIPLDLAVAEATAYQTLANMIEREFGRLDGLLHNAAVLGPITPLEHYEDGTWDQVMQVNLRAPFLLTQALLPNLRAAEQASVIFTSSSVGRHARAYWGAYAISKAGVESLCQIWSEELARLTRIRFNCINPGATLTAMRRSAYPAENPEKLRRPEEILGLYNYLMGADGAHLQGMSLDAQPDL